MPAQLSDEPDGPFGAPAPRGSGTAAGASTASTASTASGRPEPSDAADAASSGAPDDPAPGRRHQNTQRTQRTHRSGWRRRLGTVTRVLVGAFLVSVVLVSGALVVGYLLVPIPEPNQAATAQSNVYLYSDGSLIAKDGDVNRENVKLAEVPQPTQHAMLAAEDRDFYHESGVDPGAIVRAGWNMLRGEGKQSGSTITQQYVKNYYLSQERTLTRKAEEFIIAMKLDREVSKKDILAGYLNTSYFGRNSYGIQAAARAYYAKDAAELTPAEGAYLAALVNSPSTYDVVAHPENRDRALARWRYVLSGMVKEGWLSASERDAMEFPQPRDVEPPMALSGQRGYLLNAVRDYLTSHGIVSEERLATGGFRVVTTLDRDKQDAFVAAVEEQLYSRLSEEREVDSYVRAGGTSIEPGTGDVVAMYGGVGYTQQYANNATRTDYQAASTVKPFVYAAAIASGATTQSGERIGPSTLYDGTSKREVTNNGRAIGYNPQNEGDHSFGDIPVSEAMDKSVNAVFAQLGVDAGPQNVKKTLVKAGIPEDTPALQNAGASISLGTATPSTLHLAQAYATLANHGERVDYRLVSEVTRGSERIKLPGREPVRAIPAVAADAATALLQGVVEGGTGTAAQTAGHPAAGKTGTAEKDRAAWFAGYTPNLATVVAVLGQDPQTGAQKSLHGAAGLAKISGSGFPARIWGQYTGAALADEPVLRFDLSPEVPEPSPLPSGSQSGTPGEGDGGEDGDGEDGDGEDGDEPAPPTEAGRPEPDTGGNASPDAGAGAPPPAVGPGAGDDEANAAVPSPAAPPAPTLSPGPSGSAGGAGSTPPSPHAS
ncbi:transglycosylase domain-containing protein [Streptomyces sp. JJ66]|uniref:transglycosylase domain-containing protein n=1 Tax=Streptomyces sp. JJ66 TaxID=2803843 RepID=UPI0027E2E54A|nr:transglycosylase domain-containing protein [Streptomyces sp. JJ66]